MAARIVTYHRVKWANDSFALIKVQVIFHASLAKGYVPAMWHQVKAVFIPKPSRSSYRGPRGFRPISLTSFLLKTMERLVDRFLKDEILVLQPLHPNQHAYQVGKSVEMTLHQLVVWAGKALDQQEIYLGVLLDIEGVFNNNSYDSMCAALARHGEEHTTVQWIRTTLEGRLVTTTFGRFSRSVVVSRGCPQGGVLSPLLWCLVVNKLLARLNEEGVYAQVYADDIYLQAVGPSNC